MGEGLVTTTKVVNIRHAKFDVYVGRQRLSLRVPGCDGTFGNPYAVEPHGREVCISMFKTYFERRIKQDPVFRLQVLALRGKILACYCAPLACHGNVIAAWVDAQPIEEASPDVPRS